LPLAKKIIANLTISFALAWLPCREAPETLVCRELLPIVPKGALAMKKLCVAACFALSIGAAWAQSNRLPQDEAQRFARLCVARAAQLTDAQIKMEVDTDKACAERGEGGGAMVVPDKNLSEKTLLPKDGNVRPLGQLWLRKWTLVVAGQAVPRDRLRIVTVNIDDKDRPLPLFFLGVRGGGQGPELVAYASESEPLLVLPLQKMEMGQTLPLELEWKRGAKDTDPLTLNVLGKYQAVLTIAKQE